MYHISNNNKEISWIDLNKKVQVLLHYIVLDIAHKTICNMFVAHFNDFLSPSHFFSSLSFLLVPMQIYDQPVIDAKTTCSPFILWSLAVTLGARKFK